MSKASEYRERAAESEAMGRLMRRHDHRAQFFELARAWRALAETAERQSSGDA